MEIYGKNIIQEAINQGIVFKKIFLDSEKYANLFSFFKNTSVPIYDISKYRGININNQKIVAEIEEFKYVDLNQLVEKILLEKSFPKLVILDKITDPQNLGAIIRNLVAFEIDGLIIPKFNQSPITGVVAKASAGTLFQANISLVSSLNNIVSNLKKKGFWIVSTSMKGSYTLDQLSNFLKPIVIILGSEGEGISPTLLSKSDLLLSIPINNKVESLNVSSTSAIIFHSLFKK